MPFVLWPVLNTKCPLDPAVTIFALDRVIDPLLAPLPTVFEIKTMPPEAVVPLPPISETWPPFGRQGDSSGGDRPPEARTASLQ